MANNTIKDIKYINRDFSSLKQSLIDFTKSYYPNTYNDFSEASPGMLFIDIASYIGDVLSYYTDTQLRESLISKTQDRANILDIAQSSGYKPKISVPSIVNLDVYQLLPSIKSGSLFYPDWNYSLLITQEMTVKSNNSNIQFRTLEPINFSSSSLSLNASSSISIYEVDNSNNPVYYLLKTTAKAIAGTIKTATFNFTSPKRYDKIILNDTNIIEVLDIVDSDGNIWYEVPFLAQDTIFDQVKNDKYSNIDYNSSAGSSPYLLKLKKVSRRFITTVNSDDTYTIQFGAGTSDLADEELIPNPDLVGSSLYSKNIDYSIDPSNFLYSKTYGLAPANTTLTVRYTVGGGIESNVQSDTLTNIVDIQFDSDGAGLDFGLFNRIKNSIAVNNPYPATGGKDKETIDEIRFNTIALNASQNRAITDIDYIIRTYMMPSKFGSIAKAFIQKTNNTQQNNNSQYGLDLYVLGYDSNRNLINLNDLVKENLKTYLSQYRMMTDSINIKNAYIINIGIDFSIVTQPGFNSNEVLIQCISKLKEIFNINKWQINQPINLSNLYAELDRINGVQTISSITINNLVGDIDGYSNNQYNINDATKNGIIYPSYDPCCFEIKYPNKDIKGRVI